MQFKGQVALVTGAGDGIGRGIAIAFAREGADIAVCNLDPVTLGETTRMIADLGRRVYSAAFDVCDESAIAGFVATTAKELGPPTILVPNAGIMPVVELEAMDVATMDQCYSVKLRSSALFAKHVIPHQRAAGGGSITFMASVTAHSGFAQHAFYGAMNAALTGLARGLAMELAPHGIRVNSVSPGTVDSPMLHRFVAEGGGDPAAMKAAFDANHPRGRIATIGEVAAAFVFLASPTAANITATDLRCDGGFSRKGGQARA